MIRKLTLAAVAALALGGCVTDGYHGGYGGGGDYYYGQPSSGYYYDDGYGYYDRYGYGGYGRYRGYGYPYYGYYGRYGYPYYPPYYPPYHPRPPRPDHEDGPVTGGRLPPSRGVGGPQGAGQIPNTIARPSLLDGGRARLGERAGGLRRDLSRERIGDAGNDAGPRRPRLSAPQPAMPRSVAPSPRVQSSRPPPTSGRSTPRPSLSRPPASRERDTGQQVER